MQKLLNALWTSVVAVAMTASLVTAATVSVDEYRKAYGQYGRSDGLFQRLDTNMFDIMANGHRQNTLGKGFYEDFTEYGDGELGGCMQTDWTACSGTNTEMNLITFPSGNTFVNLVTGTVTAPGIDMDAASLDFAGDQVNNESVELTTYLHGADKKFFVVGDDPAFYTCVKFAIEDASGTDDFQIGFRELEPFQAAIGSYQDVYSIGLAGGTAANPANIFIDTFVATSETATDTTLNVLGTDTKTGETTTLCVLVSAAGVLTYTVNGSPPPTTAALTIADASVVIPFIKLLQDTGLTGEVDILEWEAGYQ